MPNRVSALVSAARSVLRARSRQYQSRAQLQTLEEADQRKDEFLATLAHELRNPLAPIRNSVELLRVAGDGVPSVQNLADVMGRQVAHIVRLVDDLVEISRITRGRIELRLAQVTVEQVISAAVEISGPLVDAAEHRLEVGLPDEPIFLYADATRLAQVFANLLSNAAKYTDKGGQIRIDIQANGPTVQVDVRDSGIGLAPTALPRIFDLFAQDSTASSPAPDGLGIGLTLVRSLVEMHGGKVTASSEGPGRGSLFSVSLPMAAPDPEVRAPKSRVELRKAAVSIGSWSWMTTAMPPKARRPYWRLSALASLSRTTESLH